MKKNQSDMQKWKDEILATEQAFAKMAEEQGLKIAFLHFAAEEAVLMRNNQLINGKASINEYFEVQDLQNVKLDWAPDYIDVSKSGDMAYTYGKYNYSFIDHEGVNKELTGVFHTVWKRQPDGSWKFVWD